MIYPSNSPEQSEFIRLWREKGSASAQQWLLENRGGRDLSGCEPITLQLPADTSSVRISRVSDGKPSGRLIPRDGAVQFINYLPDTEYEYLTDKGVRGSFRTAKADFRFITLEGAMNVRDLGGRKIKPEMIYRGSELFGIYKITENGKKAFCDLGIKTEIDMRGECAGKYNSCAASDSVRYLSLPFRPYDESFEEINKNRLKKIFDVLSDVDNYPVYFHCMGGADRTGMIAIYLGVILGEDLADILLDYELTSLSMIPAKDSVEVFPVRTTELEDYKLFLELLDSYAPGGFEEKILAYLRSAGISDGIMDKIRSILAKEV